MLSTFDHEKSRIVNPGTGANLERVAAFVGSVEKHVGPVEPVAAFGEEFAAKKENWPELVALALVQMAQVADHGDSWGPGWSDCAVPRLVGEDIVKGHGT